MLEAIRIDDAETLRTFITHTNMRMRYQDDEWPLIVVCTIYRSFECVKVCLEEGFNANDAMYGRCPALGYACARNYNEVARVLLEAGADPNYVPGHQASPIMYTSANGNQYIATLLVDYGADVSGVVDHIGGDVLQKLYQNRLKCRTTAILIMGTHRNNPYGKGIDKNVFILIGKHIWSARLSTQ